MNLVLELTYSIASTMKCVLSAKSWDLHYYSNQTCTSDMAVMQFGLHVTLFSLTPTQTHNHAQKAAASNKCSHPAEALNSSVLVASSRQGHRDLSLCWQALEHTISRRWICHKEYARMGQWKMKRRCGPWSQWVCCLHLRSEWFRIYKGPTGGFIMDGEGAVWWPWGCFFLGLSVCRSFSLHLCICTPVFVTLCVY